MKETILIVEDEFIVANDLSLILKKAGYTVCGMASSVHDAKILIDKHHPDWVMLDIFLQDDTKGTELAGYLQEKKIGFVYVSANTNQRVLEIAKSTQPYGFLVKPFREKDLLIMLEIATEKHRQNLELELRQQLLLKKQIHFFITSIIDIGEKVKNLPGIFQTFIPFDYMRVNLTMRNESLAIEYGYHRKGFDEYEFFQNQELPDSMGLQKKDASAYKPKVSELKNSRLYNQMEYRQHTFEDTWERNLSIHFGFQSKLEFPVTISSGIRSSLSFYSKNEEGFTPSQLSLLQECDEAIRKLISGIQQITPVGSSNDSQVTADPTNGAPLRPNLSGIVGKSPELLKVMDHISLVSQSEISVLITGESGTGKEKVAQHIHQLSARKNKPFITINCAALPHELIESELFGHEKGAYTGAFEKRTGKFEQANNGTIFLDEIGEMPLDAQVKLLRVLQEKTIEYVGGMKPLKIDVRVIAATNRKLEKEVADGRFRLDLYYRLNVYPIEVPPLRARKQDIPLLANYFLSAYAKETGRKISGFTKTALNKMEFYDWPGNIRELGHFVQRHMITAKCDVISDIELPGKVNTAGELTNETQMKTLEDMEAEHILSILKKCKGKICGTGGAAEILGLPPSTLNSKIRKLGIKRESYFNI